MTLQEFEYIRRVMEVLKCQETTAVTQIKLLRTVGQIFDQNARKLEDEVIDKVNAKITRRYQDLQNQKLVDLLTT